MIHVSNSEFTKSGYRSAKKMADTGNLINKPLEPNSPSQVPSGIKQLIEWIETSGPFRLTHFEWHKNGNLQLAYLEYLDGNLTLNGFAVNEYLLLEFNEKGKINLASCHRIKRCSNQFTRNLDEFQFRLSAHPLQDAQEIINYYKQLRKTLYAQLEQLALVAVTGPMLLSVVQQLIGDDTNARSTRKKNVQFILMQSIGKEMNAMGRNLFGLFNGVTHYSTHQLKNSVKSLGNALGKPFELNSKAFDLCLEFATKTPTTILN